MKLQISEALSVMYRGWNPCAVYSLPVLHHFPNEQGLKQDSACTAGRQRASAPVAKMRVPIVVKLPPRIGGRSLPDKPWTNPRSQGPRRRLEQASSQLRAH